MSATKIVDKLGRIVIPARWRKGWGKMVVLYRISEDEVLVRSLKKKGKLTDLIDTVAIRDVRDFTDTHKLREKLYD